jgi:hypothetical protein
MPPAKQDPVFHFVDYSDPKNWGLSSSSNKPVNWHHYEIMQKSFEDRQAKIERNMDAARNPPTP